jgi:hypothetical protein
VEVFGTLYGFLSVVAAALGLLAVTWALIKGKAKAAVMGNKFSLGGGSGDDGGESWQEDMADIRKEIKELRALVLSVRLGLLEMQVRDPNIHITRRAKLYDEYESEGGNGDLKIYYGTVIKPLLEDYYGEQGQEGA